MTLYISSFYKNIQKEFHTRDEKKSRLVKTYEYFDKARKSQQHADFANSQTTRRPSQISQREPQIRKIGRELNQMAISLDTGKRSELLHRRQQNRTSTGANRHVSAEHNPRNTSRRSSEATRNRSLVRHAQANDRLQSSNYSRHQDKHKIVETTTTSRPPRQHRRDKKSVKSTEGSSKKSTKENETAIDETEDYGMDETDELYRRISSWVDTVNQHIEADDFDKCVIMENIDYLDDTERPDMDYYDHQSPGNHHHVEIVLYNGE